MSSKNRAMRTNCLQRPRVQPEILLLLLQITSELTAASFWMAIIVSWPFEVVPRSALRCGDRIALKSRFEAVTGEVAVRAP